MSCDSWTQKLDAYIDGELPVAEARALNEHLKQCASCGAEGLLRVQQKRMVQAAAFRFKPEAAFRARIQKQIATRKRFGWGPRWFPVVATLAAVLLVGTFAFTFHRGRRSEQPLLSELVDQHVATLASANPVDVISTDRHTVKPWFAGKIPFTFNLPELQNTPFTLVGGRVAYLRQSPGAELIFRVRQHQISVFIFQEQGLPGTHEDRSAETSLSFETRSWQHNGLRYFMISDAGAADLNQLSQLIKAAD